MLWLFDSGEDAKHAIQQHLSPISWHSWPDGHAAFHSFRSGADGHIRTSLGVLESLSKVTKSMAQVALCIVAPQMGTDLVNEKLLSSFKKVEDHMRGIADLQRPGPPGNHSFD